MRSLRHNYLPRWERLRQENLSKAVEMAVDLVEGKKGNLYRSTVKDFFMQEPSCLDNVYLALGEIDIDYPRQLREKLSQCESPAEEE